MFPSVVSTIRYATLIALAAGLATRAQDTDPMARVTAAAALTSLELADQKPWHLALDVTVFDDKGANPTAGTIEVWHAGEDERAVYTFGNASSQTLRHDRKIYTTGGGRPVPAEAYEVLSKLLQPGPDANESVDSTPVVTKLEGKVALDCIMLTKPVKATSALPLGLFPTYCLDASGIIRTTFDFGAHTVILNSIGTFLNHKVAIQLDILDGQVKVGSGKVTTLTTYTPQPEEFVPPPEAKAGYGIPRISGGVIQGARLSFVQPVYPQTLKENKVSGTVVLRAIIGRDGHVHSLHTMSATNTDFAIAAIDAVRQWTYKPYVLNGELTDVDTTITVNFSLHP